MRCGKRLRYRVAGPELVGDLRGFEKFFFDVDTPEDYERALQLAAGVVGRHPAGTPRNGNSKSRNGNRQRRNGSS